MGSPRWSIFRRTKDPEYHLVSFLMKATVWANVLEERQEKSRDAAMSVTETDTVGKKKARKGQENIVSIIEADPYVSIASIAHESGLSVKTVRNLIDEMRKDNLIVRIGPDKGGYWQLLK